MESEIRSWLNSVLDENLNDFSLEILGNTEKGDGYIGDIVFVSLHPIVERKTPYHFVLKISKRNKELREKSIVKEAFLNEIAFYEKVLPAFEQFQLEKGVQDIFDSVPRCYGTIVTDSLEVIVLENLRETGYSLWGKKKPFTRTHIDLVMKEYAKFNAISIAMEKQQPEVFQNLIDSLYDIFGRFIETTDMDILFGANLDEITSLLEGDLDDSVITTWKTLKSYIKSFGSDSDPNVKIKVICHGDCWGNNFMFIHQSSNGNKPTKPALLDFQGSRYASIVMDLSYFLFASISKEDIGDLNSILDDYYENLKTYTNKLGTQLESFYSKQDFFNEWRKYCKYGVLLASLIFKVAVTEKDEVVDLSETAEGGKAFEDAFSYSVRNKDSLKERARHIVKYVVENGLI